MRMMKKEKKKIRRGTDDVRSFLRLLNSFSPAFLTLFAPHSISSSSSLFSFSFPFFPRCTFSLEHLSLLFLQIELS